jgi:hypothetical protein
LQAGRLIASGRSAACKVAVWIYGKSAVREKAFAEQRNSLLQYARDTNTRSLPRLAPNVTASVESTA